ncbi:MAG TPA: hypothetical protein VN039_04650 [Nitrospira sp.]|jgi:ABC-type lipoprotein release transport system permease subunit|nr:hypothetical protein [Nitrospira sp.]
MATVMAGIVLGMILAFFLALWISGVFIIIAPLAILFKFFFPNR